MRLLVQWTRANPQGWEELEVGSSGGARRAWERSPSKPDPTGANPPIDDAPGWVFALGCQGITFSADHYAVEPLGDGLRIIVWNDDPEDWPPGQRHALVWDLLPPAPDERFAGEMNTRQFLTVYREEDAPFPRVTTTGGPATIRPWSEFAPPAHARHGKDVLDALAERHNALRGPMSWREWA